MLWRYNICKVSCMFLLFLSISFFWGGVYFILMEKVWFVEWELVSILGSMIVMTCLFDWMSLIFMSFVLLISSLVVYYSDGYMEGDHNIDRFILLVLMFVLSMMLLIISPNIISILLGWDGLGLVSYCLVIYYQNEKSYGAGMITALTNRIGDVALLMAIAWMLNYGSFNYVFYLDIFNNEIEMSVISGLVVLAGMTKSAQIPFSAWLPAAMAAPTPVSALVHSSTLVTAGVYLLIRFGPSFSGSWVSEGLFLLSGLTMFMAGLGANFEFDLKKIIALSTLSQLGLMMSILSLGFFKLAYFHLLTHALFKALLFMCAGSVIHNMSNSQDIRTMGCLVYQMPFSMSCMQVANLSLCGFPFLAGFYSKDLILEISMMGGLNMFGFMLLFISTGLTVSYSARLLFYGVVGASNSLGGNFISDSNDSMMIGMSGLLICSVWGGSMLSWIIFPTPSMVCLPLFLKILVLLVSILGAWLGWLMWDLGLNQESNSISNIFLVGFVGSMWFLPFLSSQWLINKPLLGGVSIMKGSDQGWSEYLGGQGLYMYLFNVSGMVQAMHINYFKVYMMSLFILGLFIVLVCA